MGRIETLQKGERPGAKQRESRDREHWFILAPESPYSKLWRHKSHPERTVELNESLSSLRNKCIIDWVHIYCFQRSRMICTRRKGKLPLLSSPQSGKTFWERERLKEFLEGEGGRCLANLLGCAFSKIKRRQGRGGGSQRAERNPFLEKKGIDVLGREDASPVGQGQWKALCGLP